MFIFSRLHHSPDAEGYYILKPSTSPDDDARLGEPIYRTTGERGQSVRDHHLVGLLTLLHGVLYGNRRTLLFLSVRDGLTEEERQYLENEVYLLANVPESTNAGHWMPLKGWFLEESFFPPDAKPQDGD